MFYFLTWPGVCMWWSAEANLITSNKRRKSLWDSLKTAFLCRYPKTFWASKQNIDPYKDVFNICKPCTRRCYGFRPFSLSARLCNNQTALSSNSNPVILSVCLWRHSFVEPSRNKLQVLLLACIKFFEGHAHWRWTSVPSYRALLHIWLVILWAKGFLRTSFLMISRECKIATRM